LLAQFLGCLGVPDEDVGCDSYLATDYELAVRAHGEASDVICMSCDTLQLLFPALAGLSATKNQLLSFLRVKDNTERSGHVDWLPGNVILNILPSLFRLVTVDEIDLVSLIWGRSVNGIMTQRLLQVTLEWLHGL